MLTSRLCPLVSRSRVEPSRGREDLSCRERSLSHFYCEYNYKHGVICCYRSTWEAHGTTIRWRLSSFSLLLVFGRRSKLPDGPLKGSSEESLPKSALFISTRTPAHLEDTESIALNNEHNGLLQTQSLPAFTGPFHSRGSRHSDQHRNTVASAVLMGKSGKIKKKV